MSHTKRFDSFSDKEDSVPIGSLNILSAKYEVSFCFYIITQCKICIYVFIFNKQLKMFYTYLVTYNKTLVIR